jgi:ElaB/YqjD/DUF883 family membrane-anchored ribosome-binding protein
MELYFKDLISEDSSLEKLVDDLSRVVQGADDFAKALGPNVAAETRHEVASRLDRLKDNYARLKQQTLMSARATDKLLRKYPYSSLAMTFGLGLFLGLALRRKR